MKETLIFIEEKIRRIVELESYIFEHNKFYYDGKKENDKLKKQIEEITDKLNESNRDLKVLTKQLDEQFSLSEMLKSKVISKKELIDFQNQRISDYIISVNDLDATNNSLKQEIESLELTIQSFTSNKESFDKLSIENQELKQENGIWINEIKDLKKEIESLKSEPINKRSPYYFYFEIKEKVKLNISKEESQEKGLNEEVYIIEMKIDFDNKFMYFVSNDINGGDAFLYGFTKSQLDPININ